MNLQNIFLGQTQNFEAFLKLWAEQNPDRRSEYLGDKFSRHEESREAKGKQEKIADIEIFDIIGDFFGFGMSPTRFSRLLKQAKSEGADKVRLLINSPGGFIDDGFTIFNLADQFELPIVTRVMGIAASMAATLVQAGDRRETFDNVIQFVHNPIGFTIGNQHDHENKAKELIKLRNNLARTFSNRTGQDEKKIKSLFDKEAFLEPQEALDLNFVDEIIKSKGTEQENSNSQKIFEDFLAIRPVSEKAENIFVEIEVQSSASAIDADCPCFGTSHTCNHCQGEEAKKTLESEEKLTASILSMNPECKDGLCGVTSLPEQEGVESLDEGNRTITVQFISAGWSANGGGYPDHYMDSLATQMLERPKMYAGHKMKGSFKDKLSRDPSDWVATILEVWKATDRNGRATLKGKVQCTALPLGEAMLQQAKLDPTSVRLSIHTIDYVNRKGSLNGKQGEVHEECKFQFSTDWVSYDAANGFVEKAASLEGDSALNNNNEEFGIYEFINHKQRGEKSMKYEFDTAKEAARDSDIIDAVLEVALSEEVIGAATVANPLGGERLTVAALSKVLVEAQEANTKLQEEHNKLKTDHEKVSKEVATQRASKLEADKESFLQTILEAKKITKATFGEYLCGVALEQVSDERPENFESLTDVEQAKVRSWKDKVKVMVSEFSNTIEKDRAERKKKINNTTPHLDDWSNKEGDENQGTEESEKELDVRLTSLL